MLDFIGALIWPVVIVATVLVIVGLLFVFVSTRKLD